MKPLFIISSLLQPVQADISCHRGLLTMELTNKFQSVRMALARVVGKMWALWAEGWVAGESSPGLDRTGPDRMAGARFADSSRLTGPI